MAEFYQWVQSEGGRTCIDSAGLNERVDSLEAWEVTAMPGETHLACKGDCDCELVPVKEPEKKEKKMYRPKKAKAGASRPPMQSAGGNITAGANVGSASLGATNPDGVAVVKEDRESGRYKTGGIQPI